MSAAGNSVSTDREELRREVAVLLARHDYRFGMGGNNEAAYAFANSHKFEKRADEILTLISGAAQPSPMPATIIDLLKQLAWYYEVNDCAERDPEDALEVPLRDLRAAFDIYMAIGESPPDRAHPTHGGDKGEAVAYLHQYEGRCDLSFEVAVNDLWTSEPLYAAPQPASNAGGETAAWIAFAGNGNIRFWTADERRAKAEKDRGLDLRAFTLAELVALAGRPLDPAYEAKHPADEMIGEIEKRFPDWKSYRDLVDCIDVTLHRLRGGS